MQSWSSSFNKRALGCFPNLSIHSRAESAKKKKKKKTTPFILYIFIYLYLYFKSFSSPVNVKKLHWHLHMIKRIMFLLHDAKGKDQRSIILNRKIGILNNLKSLFIYTLEGII